MLLFLLLPTTPSSSTSLHLTSSTIGISSTSRRFLHPTTLGILGSSISTRLNPFSHRNVFRLLESPCCPTTLGILGSSTNIHLNLFSHWNVFHFLEEPCSPTTLGILGSSTPQVSTITSSTRDISRFLEDFLASNHPWLFRVIPQVVLYILQPLECLPSS